MFTVKLPLHIGTYVKVKESDFIGTIASYTIYPDGIFMVVSGYKEARVGEFSLDELEVLTEDDIVELQKKYERNNEDENS